MTAIDRLIDHDKIAFLLTIARHKSFKGAATALGVSQPTVSQRVARIEESIGHLLFRRSRIGVELTVAGEAVIKYGHAFFAIASDLRSRLDQLSAPVKVCIGMSEDFCRTALPGVIWLFMREHPQIDLRIISGTYETITSAIETKAVDFAIMRRYSRYPETTLLWTDTLVWVGSSRLTLPILDPVPLVAPISPNPARDVLTDTLRRAKRSWTVKFESVGIAGIEAALEAGVGICAGPKNMRLHGASPLQDHSSLPPLPDVDYVMIGPSPDVTPSVLAAAHILQKAAQFRFYPFDQIAIY